MCLGTSPHQILGSSIQEEHFNSNEDVHMDDSISDLSLNTFTFDNMDEHHGQQSPLETYFQPSSSVNDPFLTQTSSAEVTSFIDRIRSEYPSPYGDTYVDSSGDDLMRNSAYGFHDQTLANLSDICGNSSAYPPGLPSLGLQQMPSTPAVYLATPASIPPTAEPEGQSLKTPTKSTTSARRARKSKRGSQNRQKKEFLCHHCGRVSTCASNLQEHILTHTGVKDYSCEFVDGNGKVCLKRFLRPWGLKRHYKDVHKLKVKVPRIYGARDGDGSPSSSEMNCKVLLLPGDSTTSLTSKDDTPARSPYTPPPTVDRISITTSGPEGLYVCATCNWAFAGSNELMVHNHLRHELPSSSYCSCNLCSFENSIFETSFNATSPLLHVYGSGDDQMEVEVPEYNMKIDPKLLTPGVDDFTMMNTCPSAVAEDSTTTTSAKIDRSFSSFSPVPSTFSMDEESPISTPVQSPPRVEMNSTPWCENDIVTFTSDGFPIHNCPSVSNTTFHEFMGLDYNNMTDDERHSYLGGA